MTPSPNPGPPRESAHAATAANWISVAVITAAFVLGGVALILWNWPMFWAAVGILAAGIVTAWLSNIMDAVSVYEPPTPRVESATSKR